MGVADFFSERLRSHLGYPPTPCQARLFDTLADFTVQYETCDLLLVSGYAGTGKTSAIAAFVRTLKELKYRYVLLAPTGRAAKVLSGFTGEKAYTIHKHIYRQKGVRDGVGEFQLNFNKAKDTFFIVDEASLISIETGTGGSCSTTWSASSAAAWTTNSSSSATGGSSRPWAWTTARPSTCRGSAAMGR